MCWGERGRRERRKKEEREGAAGRTGKRLRGQGPPPESPIPNTAPDLYVVGAKYILTRQGCAHPRNRSF